jgi:hypothetical protein
MVPLTYSLTGYSQYNEKRSKNYVVHELEHCTIHKAKAIAVSISILPHT